MHAVVSSLISATLLLHAVLGCCGHHAHKNVRSHGRMIETTACCHEHQDSSRQHTPAPPCQDPSDCQGVCTYLPPQKTQFEIPLTPTPLAAVSMANPMAYAGSFNAPAWLDALFCNVAAPHVRLHLAQQVLLI